MNCKQGDLAIHMGGANGVNSENLGKVVRCVRFLGKVPGWLGNDRWEVEGGPIVGVNGGLANHCSDAYLRPIRDQDGEDEILRIAGKPQEVTA